MQIERQKIIAILASAILLSLLCFALMLVAVRVYIDGQLALQSALARQAEKPSMSLAIEELQKKVKSAEQVFSQLNDFYENKFEITEAAEDISSLLPENIYLRMLSFSLEEQNKARVSLSGFAPTRAVLLELQQNLEKEPVFGAINFPASSWVQKKDINFSVNFDYSTPTPNCSTIRCGGE